MKKRGKKNNNVLGIVIVIILIIGSLGLLININNKQKELIQLAPQITQSEKTTYIYAGNLLASKSSEAPDKTTYYIQDHLGSNRKVIDNNQIQENNFYAFGENKNSDSDEKYKFTGKELDDESQLYYYGARYYIDN